MKRLILLAFACITFAAQANEGMWMVAMLNRIQYAEMNNLGLKLTPEEIYSINQACLKDAIVRLNGGSCTGEVVSSKGLIFTNHHCAYDGIQTLSTVDQNYLTNGFCAKSFAEELPIPNFYISFLIRVEDVTQQVLSVVTADMSEADREKAISAKSKEIVSNNKEDGKYAPEVKSFFYGNEYYLFVYQHFNDIRLVGNPPESVGKFGGDTDNWMWPRHTGDFSMIRIYANANNEPAAYSKDNVPYQPKHHLPMNIQGVKEGDFAMIMGYPGRTSRYLTSYGIDQALSARYPALIESFGLKLETWKKFMDVDPATRLMYAAKYASIANTWKYYIGQTQGLKRLDVKSKKKSTEERFENWLKLGDAGTQAKYGSALSTIRDYHAEWDANVVWSTYSSLAGIGGAEFVAYAAGLNHQLDAYLKETDATKKQERAAALIQERAEFRKEYNAEVDKAVFIALTKLYRERIAATNYPSWMAVLDKKYKGNVEKMATEIFAKSLVLNDNLLNVFLAKPTEKALTKDLGLMVASSWENQINEIRAKNPQGKFNKGYREFVAGLRTMDSKKQFAPDANSTMRLTYGTVRNYKPADALVYDYYTTAQGIVEKWDNSNPEFVVPDALIDLIKKKDFGRYANEKGELVTCFIGDLDITGGNSGSPVMDAKGNLIGIAFDGNWEAMSGDIAFEPALQRTICVDVRYVLFVVEKLMGGTNIVNELTYYTAPAPVIEQPAPTPAPVAVPIPTTTPAKKKKG